MMVVVDKLDKIGADCVKEELLAIGVNNESADKILAVLASKSVEEMEALVKAPRLVALNGEKSLHLKGVALVPSTLPSFLTLHPHRTPT